MDLKRPLTEPQLTDVRNAFLKWKVIFFRDQELSHAQFLAFAGRFGTPVEYPFVRGLDGFPTITPVIKLDSPPIKAAIWLQAIGYVSKPLLPGKHTLTLHVKNTKPFFGSSFAEYNNTWNLTVTLPPKR